MAVQNMSLFAAFLVLLCGDLASCRRPDCLKMEESACSRYFNGEEGSDAASGLFQWSAFPANRGLPQQEALREFKQYSTLLRLDNYCSYALHSFLCFHYFSPCSPLTDEIIYSPVPVQRTTRPTALQITVPCREICEEAWSEVFESASLKNVTPPAHLNCSRFPSAGEHANTVCPPPAVHIEFDTPKTNFVTEGKNSSLEICYRLASTGNTAGILDTEITVLQTFQSECDNPFLGPPATEGYDYKVEITNVSFPNGSLKGDKQCINITIVDDRLIENQLECFKILATAVTANNDVVRFGGALSSNSGDADVVIRDNEELSDCVLQNKCRQNGACNQRKHANANTFSIHRYEKQNNYTYAAHVEFLRLVNRSDCKAIDVRIIECWELVAGVCPPNDTLVTIPTCPNCPSFEPEISSEYLIAGLHSGDQKLTLPGKKREGLFGPWKSKYDDRMETWVNKGQPSKK